MLEGTAKILLRTINVYNYKGLKEALMSEFCRQYTMQEVYLQLRNRRLRPTESVRRYILEMQEIAARAAVSEGELVDLIIEGLGDSSGAAGMLWTASTIGELKTLCERYERKRHRTAAGGRPQAVASRPAAAVSQRGPMCRRLPCHPLSPLMTTGAPDVITARMRHRPLRCELMPLTLMKH